MTAKPYPNEAENEICERTMRRLREHAAAMGVTVDEAMRDVIPATRDRLTAYLARTTETHDESGGTTGVPLPGYAR